MRIAVSSLMYRFTNSMQTFNKSKQKWLCQKCDDIHYLQSTQTQNYLYKISYSTWDRQEAGKTQAQTIASIVPGDTNVFRLCLVVRVHPKIL